jgi:catechol 2,3-dioxygenase-like lactoylglutathione lyase family enzyme
VRELERSLRFYRDLLGLDLLGQWTESEHHVRRLVGHPDAVLHTAILRVPHSDIFLELNEYTVPRGTPVDTDTPNPGTAHLALYVDRLDELLSRLSAAGIALVGELIEIPAGPLAGGRTVYVADPDGIRVELVESDRTLAGTRR